MERRWLRPRPERLSIDAIARTRDLEQVARIITERGQLAITGGTRTATAAVQGMPGIGKTILARQLALALDDRYPGGVIWEEIGPEVRAPEDTQPILNRWARYALTVPPNLDNQLAFDASAVRALFAAQGQPLLVILDNVWSLEAIRWLRAALPENAHLVITTRLETVMIGLGGGEYVLGLLTPDEARALIALRLNWPELPADHYDWADALAAGVGYHTLALDVAIRRLRLDARSPGTPRWREQVDRLLSHIRSGQGFERLALPDSERNQNVEAVLAYSYDRMDDTARARFRALGVFAPEATFGSGAAAALWQCDVEQADDMLSAFASAALLEAGGGDGRWRQHGLLRGYALALLRREGEYDAAAARHAAFYAAAMRTADDAQRFYEVLSDYAQLRHAFAWAIENDLELAQDLVANTANLQKAHGYGRDNLAWAEQALAAAHRRGTPAQIARAQVSLGNALQYVAGLPGEDRGARLREALAAYDAALRIYTPETVPLAYAMTQNNRANLLSDLASVPGEDRGARLREALRCALTAVELFARLQHEQYYQVSRRTLQDVRAACGDDFDTLWAALDAGPPPGWLIAPEEGETLALPPDLQARLAAAGVTDEDSLLAALAADPELRAAVEAVMAQQHQALLNQLIQRLLAVSSGEELLAFWRELPAELEEPLAAAAEEAARRARQAGDAALAQALRERAAGLRAIRAAADVAQSKIQQAWQHYIELVEAAEASGNDIAAWRAAVEAGEALLAPEFTDTLGIGDAVREHVASTWNALGNALYDAGDGEAAVAAYDRAIALQPDQAIWRRNRVATLIDLGRRAEAAEELARARALEPDAARLAELEARLRDEG